MHLHRALFAGLLALVMAVGSLSALAAEWTPFTEAAFADAQKEGKPILVHVFAPWCPVCKAQEPILQQLTEDPKFKDLVVFKIDFDTQKDAVRELNATSQSTLVVLKGSEEKGRSAGDTSAGSIKALLDQAL
ncbi:MAG: thioredoxin family protein [Methyloceanibacter sp.]